MNKIIFTAALIFAVFRDVQCSDSAEVLEKVKSKHLREFLHQRREHVDAGLEKLEKHCPGVEEKLKSALIQFGECDDKVDDSLTICEAIQKYTINCTKPLLKVVDDCLPEKARGLPNLGVKSLVSIADHLCKQTGECIFELANPCLWEDVEETNTQLDACESKIKTLAEKYKDTIPTQSELCSAITDLRSCVELRTTTSCKNPKTKTAVMGVFDAIVAPCTHINKV